MTLKIVLLFALVGGLFLLNGVAQTSKPNVIVFMSDDIGLGDIGYYHQQRTGKPALAPTPNIDKLIQEGVQFTDAHSPASLCAPTRFSMLTGNYSYRNSRPFGVWSPDADALIDPEFTTSARMAKAGGYHTAFFGKWGLGGSWTSHKFNYERLDAGALSYGFDYAVELPEGIQNRPYAFYENREWMKLKPNSFMTQLSAEITGYDDEHKETDRGGMGDSNWDPTLAGGILANKAVNYIANQKKENSTSPFFIYYCSQAVHIPHSPPVALNGVKIQGTTPGKHGDMIHELDVQVGMVIKALIDQGVYDNTLFIFTSDNGGLNIDSAMRNAGHDSSNGLLGKKGSIYEGGHRVPFVAVWPGHIKGGTISEEPIVGLDVVATIAALANQPIDRTIVKDAANLLPLFEGKATAPLHKYLIHQSKGGPTFAIRDGQWKLIVKAKKAPGMRKNGKSNVEENFGETVPVALFNLNDNLAEDEAQNLIGNSKYDQRVQDMHKTYRALRTNGESTVNF